MSTSLQVLVMAGPPWLSCSIRQDMTCSPPPTSASVRAVVQAQATTLSQANRRKYLVAT